jgi:hypothetical protein
LLFCKLEAHNPPHNARFFKQLKPLSARAQIAK